MTDRKTLSLQRVLDVAAQAFAGRPFDSVSVTEIAETAHCSTATIYDVYLNKENLFLEAMSHALGARANPRLDRRDAEPSLETILTYTEARARHLANPDQRRVSRALSARFDMVKPLVGAFMVEQGAYVKGVLEAEVQAGVAAGLLRALDAETIVYIIMAGTAYEPVLHGLMYGDDAPVAFSELVRKVFTPLVTAKGRRQLEAYLARA